MKYLIHDTREGRPFFLTFFLLYITYNIDFQTEVFDDWGIFISYMIAFATCLLFYGIDLCLVYTNRLKDYRINTKLKDLEYTKIHKSFIVSSYNSLLINLSLRVTIFYPLCKYLEFNKPIKNYSYSEIIVTIIYCIVLTDIFFYFLHKLLHQRFFYKYIHNVHHEIIDPYCVAFQYCHSVETIFNEISISLPVILSFMPYDLIYIWFIIAHINTCLSHSGYIFSSHDYHHHYKICNFGISGLPYLNCDHFFKTRYQDIYT